MRVAPDFGAAVAPDFGAAFEVLGVWAYADTEQAEKAKAKAIMKIDFISPLLIAHPDKCIIIAIHLYRIRFARAPSPRRGEGKRLESRRYARREWAHSRDKSPIAAAS